MKNGKNDRSELPALLYEIPLNSEAWEQAGSELLQTFRAGACACAVYDFRSRQRSLILSAGHESEFVRSYRDRYAQHDIWLRHEEPYRHVGSVHAGHELVSEKDVIASEFYNGWLSPQNLLHRLNGVLIREGASLCYFAVTRSRQSRAFDSQDVLACRLMVPHLRRVYQLRNQLARLEEERDAALEVLDRLPTGVMMCDEHGKPVVTNEAGQRIIAAQDGLVFDNQLLSTQNRGETQKLHRLLAGAISTARGEGLESGGTLLVGRPSGARPLSVLVSPLRVSSEISGHRRISSVVFFADPDTDRELDETLLTGLYGLTRSESRLAVNLCNGRSLVEAAAALTITTETARTYCKRILSKTGARRQSDLVHLLLLGPANLAARWPEHTPRRCAHDNVK